jgi:hypothetical protein
LQNAQNVKKWPFFSGRVEKGFEIHLICHIQFPLSVYLPETYNPWLFSQEKGQGFVINLPESIAFCFIFFRCGTKRAPFAPILG